MTDSFAMPSLMPRLRLLVAFLTVLPAIAGARSVPEPPPLQAEAYVLMDAATGQIIAEHAADERRSPASISTPSRSLGSRSKWCPVPSPRTLAWMRPT